MRIAIVFFSPVSPKKQKLTVLDKLLGSKSLTMEPPTFNNKLENS